MSIRVRIATPLDDACPLTMRQLEVLRLVACGLTTRAIADELSLAVATIDNHIGIINRLLSTNNRLSAVLTAVCHGWLLLETVTLPGRPVWSNG